MTNSDEATISPTTGELEANLAALVDWATENDVGQPLALLLHACDANKHFHVNAVVQFLVLPSVVGVMRNWVSWDCDWSDLVTLSDQLLAAPHILKLFPPLPLGKELAKQWQNQVGTSHIPLCLGCRHPPSELGLSVFFEQLRVWLVIQGFRRSRKAQRDIHGHDRRIDAAANWLRLGADRQKSRRVLDWIQALRCAPEDDQALSRLLISRIDELRVKGDHDKFLKSLRGIAEEKYLPSTERAAKDSSLALGRLHAFADARYKARIASQGEDSTCGLEDPDEIPDAEPGGPWEKRLLSGRGLRILSAEALQFLPWSWHVPSPVEQSKLWPMIDGWSASGDDTLRLLAFLSNLAILTSRSLAQAQSLRISREPQQDWTLTPDGASLHRLPPRPHERVHAHQAWLPALRPLLETLRFDIGELRSSIRVWQPETASLQELWDCLSPGQSATALFDQACARSPDLVRLTSRSLEYVLAAKVYEATGDSVLAQLLSSGYRTAFGGNCAYPSWTTSTLRRACEKVPCRFEIVGPDDANAAGSELDPRDSELRKSILAAEARIRELASQPQHWILHHNAVVTYVLAALFAATGARPVTDPFESAADFDWESKWVFVADKISPGHGGRLIPLPERALKLLLHYRRHLASLAERLPAQVAQLASELRALAGGAASCQLPFFFFLRQDTLGWYSVSEATLKAQSFFEWQLPWNIMRHRLATRLRAAKVDPEVIDAVLGHADRGVLTHGEYSARCWQADMEEIAPVLAATYDGLRFCIRFPLAAEVSFDWQLLGDPEQLLREQVFGNQRRDANRRRELRRQWRIVFALYQQTLNGRTPEALKSDEWTTLARTIRTRDGVHPHPLGVWRYNRLRSYVGHLASIRPLRLGPAFAAEHEVRSPIRASAIGNKRRLHALRTWFAGAPSHPQESKLRTCQHLALAALDIVLYSRVSWWPLLRDVLSKENCRTVVKDGKTFLEHHRKLDSDDDSPVQRYRISLRCADWLDRAFHERDADAHAYAMRPRWRDSWPIAELGPPPANTGQLVKFAAELVEQANFIELPGLIAGYRAGRVASNALRHTTWMLDDDGVLIHASLDDKDRHLSGPPAALPIAISYWKAPRNASASAEAAERMVDKIRATVDDYEEARRAPERSISRADLAESIRNAVSNENGSVSSAIWCFGAWLDNLATRDGRTGKELEPSSIARYLNSLSTRFLAIGVDFDLLQADPVETADFYERLLNHHRDIDIRFVANRLRDFHAFLTTFYGTRVIDWGSINCGQVIAHASPGLIGWQQYNNALQLLAPDPMKVSGARLAAAYLLVLSFRLGLRADDGAWLRARDFQELSPENAPDARRVVHVESYWRRGTKAPMTRRLLPQLEPWTSLETEIESNFCAPMAERRRRDQDFALFANDPAGNLFDVHTLTDLINDALSAAHGGERVTEHKARHAFADRVGCALLSAHLRPHRVDKRRTAESDERICSTLLGTVRPTRRAALAFSRAMGHAGPQVTFSAYFHRLGEWSDEWSERSLDRFDRAQGIVQFKSAVNLDRLNREPWVPAAPVLLKQPGAASMKAIVRYLGLLRAGCSPRVAAQHADISGTTAGRLDRLLERVTTKLAGRHAGRKDRRELKCLVRDLPATEWLLVSDRCNRADDDGRSNGNIDAPTSLEEATEVVAIDRQLLMWRKSHYDWMAQFTTTFNLSAEDLTLICTKRAGPETESWINASGLSNSFTAVPRAAMGIGCPPPLVLDGVRARVTDRAALVVRQDRLGSRIRGNGLILLWVAFVAHRAERQPWRQ